MRKPSQYIAKGWCQGMSAQEVSGESCNANDSNAMSWCLIGSLQAAYPTRDEAFEKVVNKLVKKLDTIALAKWNDDPKRTQAEVIELLQSIGE